MSEESSPANGQPKSPLKEITQPFIDLIHAPRALWGINLAYVIEGMVYFGMLGYLAIYCSEYIFQAVDGADEAAHNMVMVLTAGITIAMFFLGMVADKRGVRFALIAAFVCMLVGRVIWAGGPNLLGLKPIQPGVFAGDRVTLHVTELDTRHAAKAITGAAVIADDADAVEHPNDVFAVDLADGEGVAPSRELESRLVSLSRAKVLSGKETVWEIEYGSTPVKAHLFAHAAEKVGLCPGAVISLDEAYISTWKDESKRGADWEYVIRTNWAEDFSLIDKSECKKEEAKKGEGGVDEALLRPEKRSPVVKDDTVGPTTKEVSIADLRGLEDGKTDVILRDAYVTYVRNGGYFLQTEKDGPAIFVFVSPFMSKLRLATILGMLLVVVGYGMYQPAAYAAVRKFTTPKTAAMGFAMLYALMNLGGWLPSFAFLLRDDDYLGWGIPGVYWVYAGFTVLALLTTVFILNKRTVIEAEASAKAETARIKAEEGDANNDTPSDKDQGKAAEAADPGIAELPPVKPHVWLLWIGAVALMLFKGESPWYHHWEGAAWRWYVAGLIFVSPVVIALFPRLRRWISYHPLQDGKFAFFIFALIPVQTLFTYNWFILPPYINRAFDGWIGDKFELAANANPILIFIAVPIITALTQKAKVYNMMIIGTFVMAVPAFLLVIGPHWYTLAGYLLIMTIGEAMWQPRFLQYAAEIAPEGRTGEYMGVAQFPWFLTKVLVPLLYSGRMMDKYCPAEGVRNTEFMWFVFGCIAITSTILLVLAKGWVGKDFKTKAD